MRQRIRWLKQALSDHEPFLLLASLFVVFRALAPLGFRVGSYFTGSAPDLYYGFEWGEWSHSGFWPYLDYWREYPPLLPWFSVLAYRLSLLLPAWTDQRLWFSVTLRELLVPFELGNLVLTYALARKLYPPRRALRCAWLYAGVFATFYAASGWWEPLPLFFLLLALWGTLSGRHWLSAGAVGLGFMTKIVPIVIAPIGLRRLRRPRHILRYGAVTILVSLLVLAPFLGARGLLLAHVKQAVQRSSWQTVWALLDGYGSYGRIPQSNPRFFTPSIGRVRVHPTALPWPLIHMLFASLYLFLYTRRLDWRDDRTVTAFAGLTLTLFLLWSKGFSGQFTVYLVTPVVLLLPNWRGVLYLAAFSLLYVLEWPLSHVLLQEQAWFHTMIVLSRTAGLITLSLEFGALVFGSPSAAGVPKTAWGRLPRLATAIVLTSMLVSFVIATPFALSHYSAARSRSDPAAAALDAIRESGRRDMPIVFAHPTTYRRLFAAARFLGPVTQVPAADTLPDAQREDWIEETLGGKPFWLIVDESRTTTRRANRDVEAWIAARACRAGVTWVGKARLSRFVVGDPAVPLEATADLVNGIHLDGSRISALDARPGGGLCIELDWRGEADVLDAYTVFVHVMDAEGRLVAQTDQELGTDTVSSASVDGEAALVEQHGLVLPPDTSPGEYHVNVGLYGADGSRTPLADGPPGSTHDAIDLGQIDVRCAGE